MPSHALTAQGLSKRFGGFHAVRNLELRLETGARRALIGPNGAGKTTLINLLTGVVRPDSGTVHLNGDEITHLPCDQRARRGLVRTFQVNSLFPSLTPRLSVVLALCEREGLGRAWWRSLNRYSHIHDEADALLRRLRLQREAHTRIATLAYGKQRLLEIALALAARPRVLLLDEPAAGIPENESLELFEVISELPPDISVLFIEHDMNLVFRFAQQISVLVAGQVLMEGTVEEVAQDPRVREIYLGARQPRRRHRVAKRLFERANASHDDAMAPNRADTDDGSDLIPACSSTGADDALAPDRAATDDGCAQIFSWACASDGDALIFDRVSAGYGNAVVLDDLSFSLAAGCNLAVLGRNGVGKTTLLATLMGHTRLMKGRVLWHGEDMSALAPHQRAQRGLGWVPQGREIFRSLTVAENLEVVARPGPWNAQRVYALFPRLGERCGNFGNQLSGGEQQMLAIGRALMTNPALLLLDEPTEGLAPLLVDELALAIRQMCQQEELAIIMVEQHPMLALALTDNAIVLQRGAIAHADTSPALAQNPALLDRLLGVTAP